jgi:hypothetical protein
MALLAGRQLTRMPAPAGMHGLSAAPGIVGLSSFAPRSCC